MNKSCPYSGIRTNIKEWHTLPHVHTHTCAGVFTHVYMCGGQKLTLSAFLCHYFFWDRVSHGTCSSSTQLCCLVNSPVIYLSLCPQDWHDRHHMCRTVVWVLRIWIQVLMSPRQAHYWLNHLLQSQFMLLVALDNLGNFFPWCNIAVIWNDFKCSSYSNKSNPIPNCPL